MSKNLLKTPSGGRSAAHAHKLVVETAKEMALEIYDRMMQNNDWYRQLKKLNPGLSDKQLSARFVLRIAPTLIEQARATLASMLTMPIDERQKETILEALILDKQLVRGRQAGFRMLN